MDLSKLFSHSISIDKYFTFVIFKGNCVFGFRTDIWENDIELPAAFPGGSDHCRPKGKKETFGERRLSHIWSARQCYAYLIKRSFLQLKATNVWLLQTCSLKCFCGLKREESWGQLLEYILSSSEPFLLSEYTFIRKTSSCKSQVHLSRPVRSKWLLRVPMHTASGPLPVRGKASGSFWI